MVLLQWQKCGGGCQLAPMSTLGQPITGDGATSLPPLAHVPKKKSADIEEFMHQRMALKESERDSCRDLILSLWIRLVHEGGSVHQPSPGL